MEPEDMNENDIIASMLEGEMEDPMDEAEDLAESGIKPKSEREIESIVQDAMNDAVDFIEGEISDVAGLALANW